MLDKGRINRLENIAVRKVEPTEAWQEMGREYVTVLFTANLLDYVVDDKTGDVVEGDKLNPVKFQEFWTFSREMGAPSWKLSAINQVDEPATRH
jgi:predicted lipid-binding transport protein (Tim44 family)